MNTSPLQNPVLDIRYQQRDTLPDASSDPHTLAIIDFADQSALLEGGQIQIGIPMLAGSDQIEVWRTSESIDSGSIGNIQYRKTPTLIFGRILVGNSEGLIENITQNIYQQISQLQQQLDYPQMIRVWNYLSAINRHDAGMERYQSFCVGRHQAIDTSSGFETHLPAATAVGTHDDGVLVYFIAAREDGLQIENPLQVSAFDYPARYAPKSPAFSRAMVKRWGNSSHLYISGTASILGHETRHKNKLLEQLDECLNNMNVLINEAYKQADIDIKDISGLTGIKLYLRRKADLDVVVPHLAKRAGDRVHVLILHADICRDDLLLEIEGFWVG